MVDGGSADGGGSDGGLDDVELELPWDSESWILKKILKVLQEKQPTNPRITELKTKDRQISRASGSRRKIDN